MLLHGFTQNVDCWGPFADVLALRFPVDAVDAPGHGSSDPIHDRAGLDLAVNLIDEAAVADPTGRASPPVVVGYSMGGRMALQLALSHQAALAGLVLIGATPGIENDRERERRRQADHDLAERIRREPLPDFLDRWLANPLFAGLTPEAAARSARLRNRPEGLAASLECCGTGTQRPLWDRLGELALPVLLITGRDDHTFTALAKRMTAEMTAADVSTIAIAGTHAVHLEQPSASAAAVARWLESWSSNPIEPE